MADRRRGARSHLSLFAVYICGFVDCVADVFEAAESVTINMDLAKIANDMRVAAPDFF